MPRTKSVPVRWAAHARAREIKKLYRKRPNDTRRRLYKHRRILKMVRWRNPWLVAAILVPKTERECPFCAKYKN